jgi:hypothetical protein
MNKPVLCFWTRFRLLNVRTQLCQVASREKPHLPVSNRNHRFRGNLLSFEPLFFSRTKSMLSENCNGLLKYCPLPLLMID